MYVSCTTLSILCVTWLCHEQVFRPDGTNGFNIFCEAEARTEQTRNRGKKVSPRMRCESYVISLCYTNLGHVTITCKGLIFAVFWNNPGVHFQSGNMIGQIPIALA